MDSRSTLSSRDGSEKEDVEVLTTQLERNYSYTSSTASLNEKKSIEETSEDVEFGTGKKGAPDMEKIALQALHVDDDPTLNPWTFRVFFIGGSLISHQTPGNTIEI